MRAILIVFCIVELFSAGLQFNDENAILWILLYLIPFFLNLMYLNHYYFRKVILLALGLYLLYFATFIPGIIDWAAKGFPSITTTMQAETPHVQLVREGGGLLILIVNLLLLLRPITQPQK